MSIELGKGGFFEWHDHLELGPGVGINSSRIDEYVAYFHRHQFVGIFGHNSFGFTHGDLDFLSQTCSAKWLWIWDASLDDVDGIYCLDALEYCGINDKRPGIDFSRLPSLKTVRNHWNAKDCGLSQSTIELYVLWHVKPRSKSFHGTEFPADVRQLEFNWANPTSLSGLPVMADLQTLKFHYCRNLDDLSELIRVAPNLKHLTMSQCPQVDLSAGIFEHPTLQSAYINEQVVLNRTTLKG